MPNRLKMLKKCQETIKVYCVLITHKFWIWLYLGNNPFTTSHFMGRLVCFLFINKSRHCKFAPQLMIFELCISKNGGTDLFLLKTFFSSENRFLSNKIFLILLVVSNYKNYSALPRFYLPCKKKKKITKNISISTQCIHT